MTAAPMPATTSTALAASLLFLAPAALPAQPDAAEAELRDAGGAPVGHATAARTPNGIHLELSVDGLPPGRHGFHIHETGACTPDFEAAGEHLSRSGRRHGMLVEAGPHAGDLPNLHVSPDGRLRLELFHHRVRLRAGDGPDDAPSLLDDDGAALVVHAEADDYRTDPGGDAGDRIACGVLEPAGGAP